MFTSGDTLDPAITSRHNPTFRYLMSLHEAKGIVKARAAFVPGLKLAEELIRCEPERCQAAVLPEGHSAPSISGIPRIMVSAALFRELDRWGGGPPLLLVEVPELPRWSETHWPPGCTVILPLQDPRNMGAALRCAAAFNVQRVILPVEAAHPYHPDAVRPAAGVQGNLTLFRGPRSAHATNLPRPLFVLDLRGTPVHEVQWPSCFGLLVGVEGPGVPCNLENVTRVTIPIAPRVESLNATAALAIVLHTWSLRRDRQ